MGSFFVLWATTGSVASVHAMIKNYLIVHNSRNETITVEVYNSKAESFGTYSVSAHATRSISIQDEEEGTDWFDAYDSQGNWIKRGSAPGIYNNFDWYVGQSNFRNTSN